MLYITELKNKLLYFYLRSFKSVGNKALTYIAHNLEAIQLITAICCYIN